MIYILIVVLISLFIISIKLEKRIYNPLTIFIVIWTFITILASLKLNGMINYTDKSIFLIGLGCISFFIGYEMMHFFKKKKGNITKKNTENKKENWNWWIIKILLVIGLIATILLSIKVIKLLLEGTSYSSIRGMYYSYGKSKPLIQNDQLYTIFNWGITGILYALIPIALVSIFEKKNHYFVIIGTILFLLLYSFATAGRMQFIYIAIQIIILFIHYRKTLSKTVKKYLVVGTSLLVILVIAITLVRTGGKIWDSIYSYFSIPVPMFSYWVDYIDTNHIQTYGGAFFYGIITIMAKLIKIIVGVKFSSVTYLSQIINIPQEKWLKIFNSSTDYYNAYSTIFYYFYLDFGTLGILIGSLIFGVISYWIYQKMVEGDSMKYTAIYLILVQILFASFIRWQFANPSILIAIVGIMICITKKNWKQIDNKLEEGKNDRRKMKKILVFGMTQNPGGVESVIMNYYRNIDKTRVQFDFLCNNQEVAYEKEILKLGGNIYKIKARSENRKQYYKDINKFFKENSSQYSTIWVNVCSLANIDYLKYAKKYGIPYRIIHSHSSQNMDIKLRMLLHKKNRHIIQRYATDFWACSEDAGKWFFNSRIRKSNNYMLVRNAIDPNRFTYNIELRNKIRRQLNIEDKWVIGHVGRFHFEKNHEFLIDIFKEISNKKENAILLLIGQGENEEKIKEKVKRLSLQDKVYFLGIRNDVPELMQAMDVFLFPSLFEGLGLVLLEAQATGLSCYTSKEGVPQTAKVTKNLMFLSLQDTPKMWAEEIIKTKVALRRNQSEAIKNAGYDIVTETKKLEQYFERG